MAQLYSDNLGLFSAMLNDIRHAKDFILIEMYILSYDSLGNKFIHELIKKSKEGVSIYLLLDGIGTYYPPIIEAFKNTDVNIKIFNKFRFTRNIINLNSRRDHRKIMIIDNKLSYIGSANLDGNSVYWRDICVRFQGNISTVIANAFWDSYSIAGKFFYKRKRHRRQMKYGKYEILREIPSVKTMPTRDRIIDMIDSAKKEIIFETPYFLPDIKFRRSMIKAAKRGVKVILILPQYSGVGIMDIVRHKLTGTLVKKGINILLYQPTVSHAKLCLVDDSRFVLGSTNLDLRSFHFQHEIDLYGEDKFLIKQIKKHINDSIANSKQFNIRKWKARKTWQRIKEKLLWSIRQWL